MDAGLKGRRENGGEMVISNLQVIQNEIVNNKMSLSFNRTTQKKEKELWSWKLNQVCELGQLETEPFKNKHDAEP